MRTPSRRNSSTLRRNGARAARAELTNGRTTIGTPRAVVSARMRAQVPPGRRHHRGLGPADDPSRYVAQDEGSCLMANKDGHRRFGNVRRLPSGRFQIRYPGPDGRIRTGPDTYERKSDADKALVLIEI